MNIREQEYMLELDHYRSITRAAEALHITQPALSIFLANLEKSQGVALFERVGKTLVPTPVGESYIRYARQISALKHDFELEKTELTRGLRGSLRIGGLNMRNRSLMPRLLGEFHQRYPEIETMLVSDHHDTLIRMLLDGSLDLVFSNRSVDYPGIHREYVTQDQLLLVLPEGHPAERYAVPVTGQSYPYLDLKYLEKERFLLTKPGQTLRGLCDGAFAFSHISSPKIREMEFIELCCQMSAEGLGASFTMSSYARGFSYTKPVRLYLTGDISNRIAWNLFWRETTEIPGFMSEFMSMIQREA